MSIMERLLFLETEMEAVAHYIRANPASDFGNMSGAFKERLSRRFDSLSILEGPGRVEPFYGNASNPPWPDRDELASLKSEKTVITCRDNRDGPSHIFMMRRPNEKGADQGILVGRVRASHLWGIGDLNTLPAMSELSVFDASQKVLLTSIPLPADFKRHLVSKVNDSKERRFEWAYQGEEYLASSWTVFLKSRYASPSWTVVLSQAKKHVLAPTASFKKVFPLVLLMSLWVVVLLSAIQIRRHLVPLEKLKEGTRQLGKGLFDTSVKITSGDEFEDLGKSFNTMSQELGKQFQALSTMDEIDRAVLASLEKEKIVETLLSRIGDICTCDNAAIGIVTNPSANEFIFTSKSRKANRLEGGVTRRLSNAEREALHDNPHHLCLNLEDLRPGYVSPLWEESTESITILPVFIKDKLSGMIVLVYSRQGSDDEQAKDSVEYRVREDLKWARQLRDQVAVALSNSHLLEELDKLSWGALTALARAVDAKSHWTAGHSERVTQLALRVGKKMDLTEKEMDTLHRGALLHDIGKIGVPAAVLDKTGKLTDEEFVLIKTHPVIGARILEPIESYGDILSIVVEHHERYDGSGYPNGLKGEDISLGARIVAVADVFEAVTADRPYRPGWELDRAVDLIKKEAGKHFDPQVASAFLEVIQAPENKLVSHTREAEAEQGESEIAQSGGNTEFTVTAFSKPDHPDTERADVENTHR
jgi:putative nucleotidyltransferase with HDIG domain